MIDRRAEVLATCRHIHHGDPDPRLQPNGLAAFVDKVNEFAWAPGAQSYEGMRSSGSTGPLEQHRVQLGADPARRAHKAFNQHIYNADRIALHVGWCVPRNRRRWESFEAWRLDSLEVMLCSDHHVGRQQLGNLNMALDRARVIQLQWTQTTHPVPEDRRSCRHCRRTDMGARPRGGLCSSCYDFRATHKRLPSRSELRRYDDTGRWRVRA